MSMIQIVLKAVDQYSGVLTGLNQSFELASKGLNFVKGAADMAFGAIKAGADLAAQGGQYGEIRSQFNNVANSYGVDGKRILDSLDLISGGTVGLVDAAKVAGKGITSGLNADQIEKVLTFVKRRTELTGESFTGMSEQVFQAFATGKTSILGQLGIFAEKTDTTADLVRKLEQETARFGGTGFNIADVFQAISVQVDKFKTGLGFAINETSIFRDGATLLVNTITRLVSSFDPRPITVFIDAAKNVFSLLVEQAGVAFPVIKDTLGGVLNAVKVDTFSVVEFVGRGFFQIVKFVSGAVNTTLDILSNSGIVFVAETIIGGFISAFSIGFKTLTDIIGAVVSTAIFGISEVAGLIGDLTREFPLLSEKLGLDPVKIANLEVDLKRVAFQAADFSDKVSGAAEAAGDMGVEITTMVADAARNFRIDEKFVEQIEDGFLGGIAAINRDKDWAEELGDAAGNAIRDGVAKANLTDIKSLEERRKQQEKAAKDADTAAKKRAAEATKAEKQRQAEEQKKLKQSDALAKAQEKASKDADRAESQKRKDIEKQLDGEKKITGQRVEGALALSKLSGEQFVKLSGQERRLLEQEADRQERMIKDRINYEHNLRIAELRERARLLEQLDPLAKFARMAQEINWPAETEAMMRWLLMWLASIASQEQTPLAITTGA